jgi:hypothetical protein
LSSAPDKGQGDMSDGRASAELAERITDMTGARLRAG